jgi:hypothetical protein
MAIPFLTDLASIMNVNEFAISVTYSRNGGLGTSVISGIFDNETMPVEVGGVVSVHQEQPRFTCRTADIPNISEEDKIIFSATTYVVRAWIHDGTGVTVLQLEKQ